jgi:FixJ family two-component response regulator
MRYAEIDRPLVAIVDDDASVRKALRRLLGATGYVVETFAGGAEFLARDSSRPVDCLVLDVRMTGLTGLDLQRHLEDAQRELPIVMITGHGSADVRLRALAAGAVAVLDKPFSDQTLLDAIRRALAR